MESLTLNGGSILPDLFPELGLGYGQTAAGMVWGGPGPSPAVTASTVAHNMASSEVTEVLGYSEEIVGDDMIEINNED